MNLYPKNKLSIAEIKKFIVIFYIIGILGFVVPFTKDFFILITPLALIMNTYLLAIYHKSYSKKTIFIFGFVFFSGFFIEVFGVSSGLIFGEYYYGNTLGPKLFKTPLLIGLNWMFLSYISISISERFINKDWLIIILAPLLMVIYDVALEQVAPKLDMWYWLGSVAPIKNYIAWFFIALCFVFVFMGGKVETKNPLAPLLFLCQFIFFVFLSLFIH